MMRRIGAIVLALGVATITSLYLYGASNRSFATREQFERQRRQVFERRGIQARPRFVTLRNPAIETHFLELGNGPAVVVIHGGGGNSSGWSPILWPLSQRFHLFVPDRPGHELTDAFDYSGIDFRRHVVNFAESFLDS